MEGISEAYLFNFLGGGSPYCVLDRVTCESDLEGPYLRSKRTKLSGCLSAASCAAFETRSTRGGVTRCHSATTKGLSEASEKL